ncbi:alpha-2-macroglobulin-like [Mixophyes fleayi]|uniref:alpha-2-macroglobulin-like n=1 Tax=Mixophyes fleayi TaxID=3061075 RepID=UPI003F4D79A2
MHPLALLVWIITVQFYHLSNADVHYVVIFSSEMHARNSELACVHLEEMQGEGSVQLTLQMKTSNITLIDKRIQGNSFYSCMSFEVPDPAEGKEEVALMKIFIESANTSVSRESKVLLKGQRLNILIQTDKPVYKPGQTVKFRVLSLKENLHPGKSQFPLIELQDPEKNRIGQWRNVSLEQGIAELSLPLSVEPPLGEYSITVKNKVHTFSVEEYVLPKIEFTCHAPKVMPFNSKHFPVKICARYTYGKPVPGDYKIRVCRKFSSYNYRPSPNDLCLDFSGKLDISGCSTLEVESQTLYLTRRDMDMKVNVKASITEDGTGIESSKTSETAITDIITKVLFIESETSYKAGIPYSGVITLVDAYNNGVQGHIVHLCNFGSQTIVKTLLTDQKGQASFKIENTNHWEGMVTFMAKANFTDMAHDPAFLFPRHSIGLLNLNPTYTRNNNYLKIHSLKEVLPCEGQQEVKLEYIIKQKDLRKNKIDNHLDVHYLGVSRSSIIFSGHLEIPIRTTDEDVQGETSLKLSLIEDLSPTFEIVSYILFPDGEIIADSAKLSMQRCFKNKVSVGFSPDEVLPGSDVSLRVQAAPGSLCGLRVVDKSVVLLKPEKELTADEVHDLFPSLHSLEYDTRVVDSLECEGTYYAYRRTYNAEQNDRDVLGHFENLHLKIITSAVIKKPVSCGRVDHSDYFADEGMASGDDGDVNVIPEVVQRKKTEKVRTYFPETWIWKLAPVGDSGSVVLQDAAPHTITDWKGGAICMGPSGFGMSTTASLRVFQPFFVELTLPYSVVRGEIFILKATVFNYLKHCIKVKTSLQPSAQLEERPCADCQYSSCLCVDESKTFYWDLKAAKLGEVNITVRTEAVDTQELCQNEVPFVPQQGSSDTVVKPLLVQPGGVLEEKSYSSLLCSRGADDSTKEDIFLKLPKNILMDSERAHVTVIGDLMGTAMQNLDNLLAMPYGCGEQNMVLFVPNIFILQYLEKTHQLKSDINEKAIKFLESGYQRQLLYKHDDGAYSAFGKHDESGNTWLTAFVVKSFSKARQYIFIDENHLTQSSSWLYQKRMSNGCFRNVGQLFQSDLKGGVEDDISLSAYVTIALLEAGVSIEDPLIRGAMSCLGNATVNVKNVYTQALLAYAFTLSGETELRKSLLDKLDEKAVREDGQLHWERNIKPQPSDSFWYRAPSAEVEMTSYVLLAYLSSPKPDLGKASAIVRWLLKQQNPNGGFASTQDTVVALQALAKYAEVTFTKEGNVNVTISSKTGFLEQFHVDNNNRLLLQRATLPTIPGEYTVTSTGSGCVSVNTALRYNIPPPSSNATFAVTVEVKPGQCVDPVKKLEIHITAKYTGSREKSNMAIIEVKMLSGYIPVKSTVRKLENDKSIQRSDIQTDMVTLYLDELGHRTINLSFQVEQDIEVRDLKPATVKVYDYYETDEQAVAEYNSPCSTGETGNAR